MFPTSYVHHQEHCIVHADFMLSFPPIYVNCLAGWGMCVENIPYKAACTIQCSWWWTWDVRNMYRTRRTAL